MNRSKRGVEDQGDALDVLEREDNRIRLLFERLTASTGRSSVSDRYDRGNVCKQLIRRMAVRESARADVLEKESGFDEITARLGKQRELRREAMDRVEKMARGIQGIALNTGQDFDGAMVAMESIVSPEIDWELNEAIPLITESCPVDSRARIFRGARYLRLHAPSHLRAKGTRWYQRVPILRRMITVRDHLEDYPMAARGMRS